MNKPKLIEVRKKQILEKKPPGPPEWKIIETNEIPQTAEEEDITIMKEKRGLVQKIKNLFRF